MKILSLYWGICSSASLLIDGKVTAATHEERFTRKKNDDSFPEQSINYCLQEAGISADDLDGVAIASIYQDFHHQVTRPGLWSIDDYLAEQKDYWRPKLYDQLAIDYLSVPSINRLIDTTQYPSSYWKNALKHPEKFPEDRESIVANYLGIEQSKVKRIEHHKAHAYYSYYASSFRNTKILSFTIDGHGDGLNATIGIFQENGHFERKYETNNCNIARVYRYITLLLGMKPNEHEFKVMGLAPYGKEKYAKKALDVFRETLYVDGLDFKWKIQPTDSYFWFKDRLEGIRFDSIAWALQEWTEELLCNWVNNAIDKFGVNNIILSGGVAMNIKAMGKIAELEKVNNIFVGGSASDESLSISAGFCLAEELDKKWLSNKTTPITNLYIGCEASVNEEKNAVEELDTQKYIIFNETDPKQIAKLLAEGKVLARSAGRMEFGQRALGNRSILADPVNMAVKEKINQMIKSRDFWMPFAPVILDKYVDKYLVNPKKIFSPYMTIGFQTTEEGYNAMVAACHPADKSARPEMLTEELNPELYTILKAFESLTGRGALLNTSFNLHGFPIVNTPQEAICVLSNSGLDGLILNNYLILKK